MNTLEGNKIKVSRNDLALIENFMDYMEGYLSEWITWNDLMPVVEKISKYHYPEYWGARGKPEDANEWDDTAYLRTFGMRDDEGNYMVRLNANTLMRAKTLVEATWLAVVDFIQYYNTRNE